MHESAFTYGANVGWVVTGGDIDNRNGSKAVNGTTATVRIPKGERMEFAFGVTSVLPNTEFGMDFATPDSRTVTLRAKVGEGGYWLRSTRKGYERDWAMNSSLFVVASPAGRSATASPALSTLRVV